MPTLLARLIAKRAGLGERRRGQAELECALIIAAVAVALIVVLFEFGPSVAAMINNVATSSG